MGINEVEFHNGYARGSNGFLEKATEMQRVFGYGYYVSLEELDTAVRIS
ncbi:hypothetical protein [Rubritalea tangerina]